MYRVIHKKRTDFLMTAGSGGTWQIVEMMLKFGLRLLRCHYQIHIPLSISTGTGLDVVRLVLFNHAQFTISTLQEENFQ